MKRHRSCKIALVVFFLLYALSPLTYDLSAGSTASDLSRGTPNRTFRSVSLYLIEVLYDVIFDPPQSDSESSPNRVLIRKKSALQRGRYVPITQTAHIAGFAAATLTAHQHFSIETERAEVVRPWLRKNGRCLPLSSGLSPPLPS